MTRIVIVDPQPAARAGLAMLLRAEPGLVPVGTATGAHDGADLVARRKPDVVLCEHRLPDGDGPALTRRLRALENPPQVILYTAEPDPSLGLLARVAGAAGLVDKQAEPAELFEAVRVVARGGSRPPRRDRRGARRRRPPRRRGRPRAARDAGRPHAARGRRRRAAAGPPARAAPHGAPARAAPRPPDARASPPRRARGARSRVPAPRPRAGRASPPAGCARSLSRSGSCGGSGSPP